MLGVQKLGDVLLLKSSFGSFQLWNFAVCVKEGDGQPRYGVDMAIRAGSGFGSGVCVGSVLSFIPNLTWSGCCGPFCAGRKGNLGAFRGLE